MGLTVNQWLVGFDSSVRCHRIRLPGAQAHKMLEQRGSTPRVESLVRVQSGGTNKWGRMYLGGEVALQAFCGGFDSHRLHQSVYL